MTPNSRSYLNHFTQPDTIVPDPGNSQDYDRYAYARNNPIKYTDPSGHCTVSGHWLPDSNSACKWASSNQNKLTGNGNGAFLAYNIVICGRYDGFCGDSSNLKGYDNNDGYTILLDEDSCGGGGKANCANYVYNFMVDHPGMTINIVGHSAGADIAILAADKAVNNGIRNLNKVTILDPTLTSGAGHDFPDYQNGGDNPTPFGGDDDLGPLIKNILDHEVPVFVGLGKIYANSSLQAYLDPFTANQAEFAQYQSQGLYSYNFYQDFSHPAMATEPQVRNNVLDFLK